MSAPPAKASHLKAPLYLALLHYPVYKKTGEVITTSITPMDLHDIARSAMTFGVRRYYVVNPMPTMQYLARRVEEFWRSEYGARYNQTRTEALSILKICSHLEECVAEIEERQGEKPVLVATSARMYEDCRRTGYEELAKKLREEDRPYLLLLGTGWGLIQEFLRRCDWLLEPIQGAGEYNHLSVRGAAAIILDRLCGNRKEG
ncbi:MAG: RNA methyltransferase [bacterium]